MESILETIKKLLGPDSSYEVFDEDIIIHINTALADLTQLGVGPEDGFEIFDVSATWNDFVGKHTRPKTLSSIKTYVYISVKLVFDPPTSAAVITSYENRLNKLEWRISHAADILNKPESEEGSINA